ncbi:hypothetical protein QE152_g36739 [Popillia japonica]|uniref:Uncharacterized protein n=1 Tax=Popillia japonica TaxID=7064 RepID=A0AAW1ICV5_POPJA
MRIINEVNFLKCKGFKYNGAIYAVHLEAIVCDAPARAFIKSIKGQRDTRDGCERCFIKGSLLNHRMVFTFETDENELRTDTNFRERLQPEHHLDESPLTKLHDFGLISNMPLDYMHMILNIIWTNHL